MDLNVNVKFDATPALVECVNTLATAISGMEPQVETENAGPAVTERAVEFMPTQQVMNEGTTQTSETDGSAVHPGASSEISDEELRALVGPKTKEFGKEKVFALLDEFGVKRVPDLNQEQRKEFVEKLNAL